MSGKMNNLTFEKLTIEKAKKKISDYDFVIAHMISELQYGRTEDVTVNWEELLELRAFSATEELRVWSDGSEHKAQCCKETGTAPDDTLEFTYAMRNGKKLAVKEYLEPDEDGQVVVVYTRPFDMR